MQKDNQAWGLSQISSDPICGTLGCGESKFGKADKIFHVEYPDPDKAKLDSDIEDSHSNLKSTEDSMGRSIELNYHANYGSVESVTPYRAPPTHEEMRRPSDEFFKSRRRAARREERRLEEMHER